MQYACVLLKKAPRLYTIHMALLLNFMSRQFQKFFNHFHLVLLIILFRAVAYNAQGFHNDHLANDDLLNAHRTRTMPHNTCAVRTYHSIPRSCIVLLLLQHYIQCPWIWKTALRPTAVNSQALWTFTKKNFPPCFRLILKARTHCLPLFRSLAPRLVPSRTSVFTTAGQIAQSGRNAIRPSCSIQVFKRVGKIILTKQIIGKKGRISIIC